MNFELFEPTRSNPDGRGVPTLRVLSGGRLVLNAAAKRLLGDTQNVQLLWDADAKRIGLKPVSADAPGASFRVVKAPSQAVITSKEFVDAHALQHNQRMRLEWEDEMWVASTINPAATTGQPD